MGSYVELLKACKEGNHKKVRKLLYDCKNIGDVRDLTDKTLLHYCFKYKLCADLILDAAPELLDVGDKAGYTVLHLASMMKPPSSLEYILSKNPDINKQNNDSRTPLLLSVIYENYEAIELLCQSGADVNVIDSSGISPLHYTAKAKSDENSDPENQTRIIDLLLKHNANIEFHDFYNRTPLMWAVCSNNIVKMKYLIERGSDLNARDISGLSILHYATSNSNEEIIKILIDEYNFDIDIRDNNDCTSLMYACTTNQLDIIQLLLDKGANSNSFDSKLRNCAHFVCGKGELNCLKLLKHYNTDLWKLNNDNNFPLHEAAYRGHKEIVEFLIDNLPGDLSITSVINQKNSNNQTPLHLAAVKDQVDISRMLLQNGADPNITLRATNGRSMTALDLANDQVTKSIIIEYNGKTGDHLIKRAPIKEETTISIDTDSGSENDSNYDTDTSSDSITSSMSQKPEDEIESTDKLNNNENETFNLTKDDLFSSTLNGDVATIELYRNHNEGSLINIFDNTDKSLLHYSLKNDVSFEYMCKHCMDLINQSDEGNITALNLAIMSKNNRRILPLLKLGAKVNDQVDLKGRSALHLSVIYGNLEALKILRKYGEEINDFSWLQHRADDSGNFPLHYAVELVKSSKTNELNEAIALEYVDELLNTKCDIECKDFVNRTPLLLAVNVNSHLIVEKLLLYKPNIMALDNQGLCSIHYVCSEANLSILNLLATCENFNCNTPDPNGLTPIFYAVASCDDKLIKRLIELGADLKIVDNQGRNLCHKAAEKCAFKCMELLIEYGIESWLQSNDGTVPLHEAAYRGYKEIIEMLIKTKSPTTNIDIKNFSGQTALHLAAARNDCPICYLLINNGSNVNEIIYDSNIGQEVTPYDLATTQYCRSILKQFGGKSAFIQQQTILDFNDNTIGSIDNKDGGNDADDDGNTNNGREFDSYFYNAISDSPIMKMDLFKSTESDYHPKDNPYQISERSTEKALSTLPSSILNYRTNAKDNALTSNSRNPTRKESETSLGNDTNRRLENDEIIINSDYRLLENIIDFDLIDTKEVEEEKYVDKNKEIMRENSLLTSENSKSQINKKGCFTTKASLKLSDQPIDDNKPIANLLAKETSKISSTTSKKRKNPHSKLIKSISHRSVGNYSRISSNSSRIVSATSMNSTTNSTILNNASSNSSSVACSRYIEEKVKGSIINYEYIRINAQLAVEMARFKIRKENIDKLINPKTPQMLRKKIPLNGTGHRVSNNSRITTSP